MPAFTSDERKYIKAIGDYRSKKIDYSKFIKTTLPLDVSNRVRETHTITGRKFLGTPKYKKGGKMSKMRGGGIVQKKLTYRVT